MLKCLYIHERGRSSVDFLYVFFLVAVVAMIAVVGVNKYRVYRHSDGFALLFYNTLRVYSYLKDQNSDNVSDIFNVFKLVPEGMKFDKDVFNDNFNSNITIKNRGVKCKNGEVHYDYYMMVNFYDPYLGLMPTTPKVCHNFLNVIKNNSDNIEWIDIRQGSSTLNFKMFGKKYCHGTNCLSSLTHKNIEDLCYYCTSGTYCSIYIQLNTKMIKEKDKKKKKE